MTAAKETPSLFLSHFARLEEKLERDGCRCSRRRRPVVCFGNGRGLTPTSAAWTRFNVNHMGFDRCRC